MKDIIVFGHKNPDTDSISASISFGYLLEQLGEDVESCALGEPSDEAKFALDYFGLEAPRVIEKAKGQANKVALVDHNEFQQSVSDIREMEIHSVVDHHKIANFETAGPVFYRAEPIGSTCSILAKLYKENEVEIPKHIAGVMVSAIISDTLLFKSPTCTGQDEKIAKELAEIAGINLEEYGLNLLKAGANSDKKTEEEILEGDAKSFEFEEEVIRIGQVNVVEIEDISKRKNEIISKMDELIEKEGYSAYLLVVTNILESNSIGYIRGTEAGKIADAFGKTLEADEINLDGVVSRKKQVVPPITDKFN